MNDKPTLSQKYENTQRTLQSVVETLTRVDVRLGIFIENLASLEETVNSNKEKADSLGIRIAVIESKSCDSLKDSIKELKDAVKDLDERVDDLSSSHQEIKMLSVRSDSLWSTVGTILIKLLVPIIIALTTAAIMYHFNISKGP